MRFAILQCDHVAKELLPQHGDYPAMFRQLFSNFDFTTFEVNKNRFPKTVSDFDAYFVTGSKYSVYDEIDWIEALKKFVVEIHEDNRFYIGICFGHQILAESLGGKVAKNQGGWCAGIHTFNIEHKMPWMQPFESTLSLPMMCQDQVINFPHNSIVLAGNEACPTAMFQVGENMLGIQAHPEFSTDYQRALIERRINRIGLDKSEIAIKSLSKKTDEQLFKKWVENWLIG